MRAAGGGRKRHLPASQKSSITRITPPDELMSDTAVRIWKTQSRILIDRGLFEPEDAPLLLAYCNAFHLMITAEKVIAKLAVTDLDNLGLADVGGTGGLKKHPAIAVRNDCVAQLARLSSILGLDPLSRVRMLTSGKGGEDEGNEFEEF